MPHAPIRARGGCPGRDLERPWPLLYYYTKSGIISPCKLSLGKHFAAVVIRNLELYDQGKRAFWFHLRLRRLRSSENQIVGVASRSRRTKPITKRENVHCDWFILPLLLPTPTIWFSLDRKRQSHKRSRKEMETFWFFWLRFRRAYDSATTPIFDLQWVKRSCTTPLTSRPTTPSLVKTSLYASRV